MRGLGWNLALAVTWVALTGETSGVNIAFGFGLGLLVLVIAGGALGAPGYVRFVARVTGLALYFMRELALANLQLAIDVVVPRHMATPAIIAVPLAAETDLEISLLASLLTLTPGSVTIDVSADRKTLYVHVLYLRRGDVEATRQQIKQGFERRILEVTR
ncbi:MAG: Na+/H+ antiporter subunit E [Dehalococcoidia bacterium]